jgi:signal transduction histidine kinase
MAPGSLPQQPPAPPQLPDLVRGRGGRLRALRRLAAPQRVDVFIAAGLLLWGLPDVPWWWEPHRHSPAPASTTDVLGSLALTLLMSVPFCWRRTFPVPVLGAALTVLGTRAALDRNLISAFAAVLIAAYGLGACSSGTRRYARWLGWASLAAAAIWVTTQYDTRLAAVPFALLGAAFVLGDAASARRAEAAATVAAAHQAERTRIARELHDVVAHQLSAIALQAGATRLATANGGGPAGAPPAGEVLGTVEELAREALAELSHLLGALRQEPGPASRRPAPSLRDVDSLLAASRAAGVPVTLATEGSACPLSPGAELSAYRIIQEALANVARHAPGASAAVTLRYQPAGLGIEVSNGPPPAGAVHSRPPRPGGRGLRGMRERAELHGGRCLAAPAPGGGFTVSAVIPCAAQAGQPGGQP